MEHKLEWKYLALTLLVGAGVLLAVMVCGALIGTKTPSPQSVALPSALAAIIISGAVMGILCARYISDAPIIHSLLCALTMTLMICLASLGNEHDGSVLGAIIPALSLLMPPVTAYLATPKSTSKRKLKRLGLKL